jgi:hypothetical protein
MNRRPGYVLMMVIVVLLILTTALTTLASKSLRVTQQASNAAALLQQRWGIDSTSKQVLPFAGAIFFQVEAAKRMESPNQRTEPISMFAESVILGGQRFDLVLSDENTKLNLNTVYHLGGPSKVTKAISELAGKNVTRYVVPRPAVPPVVRSSSSARKSNSDAEVADSGLGTSASIDIAQAETPAFRSWGEIFDFGKIAKESPNGDVKLDFTRALTLWGSGQLNISRSTSEALLAQIELILPGASAKDLLSSLRKFENVDLQAVLETEVPNAQDRRALSSMLSLSSFAFSLFIDVDAPQGRSRRLIVSAMDVDGSPQNSEFVFH